MNPRTRPAPRCSALLCSAFGEGVMIYYPVFGAFPSFFGGSMDDYLRDTVAVRKDVEGLCNTYRRNLYHNVRCVSKSLGGGLDEGPSVGSGDGRWVSDGMGVVRGEGFPRRSCLRARHPLCTYSSPNRNKMDL